MHSRVDVAAAVAVVLHAVVAVEVPAVAMDVVETVAVMAAVAVVETAPNNSFNSGSFSSIKSQRP